MSEIGLSAIVHNNRLTLKVRTSARITYFEWRDVMKIKRDLDKLTSFDGREMDKEYCVSGVFRKRLRSMR